MAEALYRKYRPQVFEDVVGQEPIERTLKNAISQDKVSHAYLFTGPRGTGKTTTARLLAKALLCEQGPTPDPDGICEDCRLVADGTHPDVYELDAASRTGVENVRDEIISRVHFAPTRGRSKVYIVDEVHMLSTAAFNALLKTLEEPPEHVVFILCTTDPQKVPETIHSRCQRFDFHRISPESMVARLGAICIAEDVEFEGEALDLIAQRAGGGLRDALTSLEQIIAFENGRVTLKGAERLLGSIDSNDLAELVAYVGRRDIANCFRWTAAYVETGVDLAQFTRDMAEHVRNLYLMALVGDEAELDVSETARRELTSELAWFGADRAARLLGVLGDLMAELKTTSNPRLAFEIALTRMVRPDSDLTLESLAERIEALESGYSAVAHVLPGEPAMPVEPVAPASAAADSLRVEADAARAATSASAATESFRAEAVAAAMDTSAPAAAEAYRLEAEQPSPQLSDAPGVASGQAVGQPASRPSESSSTTRAANLANPAAMQRIWQAALTDVKKQKAAHGVLFMNVKAVFDEAANAVRVMFPAEASFAFNAAQKPDVQDALGAALAKAVGEAVEFRFEQAGAQQAAPQAQTQPQAAPQAQVQTQPQAAPQARTQAQAQTQPQAAPQAQTQAQAPQPTPAPPADEVPYEPVPYDEVPYEEFDMSLAAPLAEPYQDARGVVPQSGNVPGDGTAPQGDDEPANGAVSESGTASEDGTAPANGAVPEDTAAVQALLQASFGEGVVLSEATD